MNSLKKSILLLSLTSIGLSLPLKAVQQKQINLGFYDFYLQLTAQELKEIIHQIDLDIKNIEKILLEQELGIKHYPKTHIERMKKEISLLKTARYKAYVALQMVKVKEFFKKPEEQNGIRYLHH